MVIVRVTGRLECWNILHWGMKVQKLLEHVGCPHVGFLCLKTCGLSSPKPSHLMATSALLAKAPLDGCLQMPRDSNLSVNRPVTHRASSTCSELHGFAAPLEYIHQLSRYYSMQLKGQYEWECESHSNRSSA